MVHQELKNSDYRIRKLIGTLGLCLPFILLISKGELLASMSHYYYATLSSLFFIIILSAFALFLISYRGYKKDATSEIISDDIITNIGGFAALVVVFVPTCCTDSNSAIIDLICKNENYPLFGHKSAATNAIHLISAAIFILSMGWMSKYKFTRNKDDVNNKLYNICGNIVFISVALILVMIILEKLGVGTGSLFFKYYVFIFETTAVIPFGISWLVKGKAIDDVKSFLK
ncbi:hypothetical protein Q4Q39_05325 [Flavivirga amylovorans]|uniref:DUF998 domain-containing protein n=1 Tax=Flavivirga amylovorans TaxID=870486 RepID=A0ABT8WYS5_9FLAO|nr:hypothetical protein [Flavivirga amylovorans]MDO5986824.1 hypothetical protein [Flavivirga amylovorans]